jgi:hypothetical protein
MSDDRTPLDDFEAADLLHRMVWDLAQVRGETTRGDTALKASRAALLLYLAALVSEPQHEPEPSSQRD